MQNHGSGPIKDEKELRWHAKRAQGQRGIILQGTNPPSVLQLPTSSQQGPMANVASC